MPSNCEIRSPHLPEEDGIACKDTELFSVLVGKNKAGWLKRVPWSWDDSSFNFSDFELTVIRNLHNLELGDFPFGVGPHDDGDVELHMSGNKISMVVGEYNIFQVGPSLGDIVPVDEIVVGGVDDVGLTVRLNVVCEDREHAGFELGDIDTGLGVLRDDLNFGGHCECIGKYNVNEFGIGKYLKF